MARIELPGGAWAETPDVLTHRMTYQVESMWRQARKADEADEELPDVARSFLLVMVSSWSLGELTAEAIDTAPAELVDALFTAAMDTYRDLRREATELPQA